MVATVHRRRIVLLASTGRETEDDEFATMHPTASGSFSRECRKA